MDFASILKQVRIRSMGHALVAENVKATDKALRIASVVFSSITAALSVSSLLSAYVAIQYIQVALSPLVAILSAVIMIVSSADSVDAHVKASQKYDSVYTNIMAEACKKHTDAEFEKVVQDIRATVLDASQSSPVLGPTWERKAAEVVTALNALSIPSPTSASASGV